MPLHRVTIRKAISGSSGLNFKWSNVYYVEATGPTNAVGIGSGIWTRERNFHHTDTFCYQIYASDLVPNTINFAYGAPTAALQFGTYAGAGEWYTDFTCVRVDLFVPNSRSSRKFYRPPFREGDIANGLTLAPAFLAALTTGMDQIRALPELRDESGNPITGWANMGITSKRLGRDARHDIPSPQGA